MNLRHDIEEVRKKLEIDCNNFREVKYYAYENILRQIGESFTFTGKRATQYFRMNHNLKGDIVGFMPNNEIEITQILNQVIPNNPDLWFIGANTKNEKPKYWLYESNLESVIAILNEMYVFDFYLVDKKYNWLISEEHSGVLVSVGEPISSNLQQYKYQSRKET